MLRCVEVIGDKSNKRIKRRFLYHVCYFLDICSFRQRVKNSVIIEYIHIITLLI